jgi:hypothetical protein
MSDDIVHEKKTEGQFVLRPGGKKQKDEALLTYVMHTPQLMEMGMRAILSAPRDCATAALPFCPRACAGLSTTHHFSLCPFFPLLP